MLSGLPARAFPDAILLLSGFSSSLSFAAQFGVCYGIGVSGAAFPFDLADRSVVLALAHAFLDSSWHAVCCRASDIKTAEDYTGRKFLLRSLHPTSTAAREHGNA
jgi:hypothetical protein